MRATRVLAFLTLIGAIGYAASSASALPLITSATESASMRLANPVTNPPVAGTVDPAGLVVSSNSNPGPGQAPTGGLQEGAFQYTDRTHEFTNPRVNAAGVLTTAATGTLLPFPYYLQGLEYVQTSNDNRDLIDYRLDVTLSAPVTAFLMIDNRANGTTIATDGGSNTDDPVLTGNLAWVIADGWTRVRSGQMPNGQSDYLGADEGAALASNLPADRVHNGAGNVAGPGEGLNQFYAIYRKDFAAGTHTGFTKQNGIPGGGHYGVAVSTPVGPIVAGDVNGSGVADINDYIIIRNNFFGTGRTRAQGDLTSDGVVNFADFRNWKDNRTAGSGSSTDDELFAGLGVPEPGSLALALFGALAWLAASRRRAG
jgi:hypothetical protein